MNSRDEVTRYFRDLPTGRIKQEYGNYSEIVPCCVGAHLAHILTKDRGSHREGTEAWAKLMGGNRVHAILILRQAGAPHDPFGEDEWAVPPRKVFEAAERVEKLPDLMGADLSGVDLTGADLRRADLRGANLCHASLGEADLREANLSRTDLSDAVLRESDLADADLTQALLVDAILPEVIMTRANLDRANLQRAYLPRANLHMASMRYANLRDTDLHAADMTLTDLTGADLTDASYLPIVPRLGNQPKGERETRKPSAQQKT